MTEAPHTGCVCRWRSKGKFSRILSYPLNTVPKLYASSSGLGSTVIRVKRGLESQRLDGIGSPVSEAARHT